MFRCRSNVRFFSSFRSVDRHSLEYQFSTPVIFMNTLRAFDSGIVQQHQQNLNNMQEARKYNVSGLSANDTNPVIVNNRHQEFSATILERLEIPRFVSTELEIVDHVHETVKKINQKTAPLDAIIGTICNIMPEVTISFDKEKAISKIGHMVFNPSSNKGLSSLETLEIDEQQSLAIRLS